MGILIWLAFVAFLCGGFPFLVSSLPSILAFLPVPNVSTLSDVFGVRDLYFAIRASIWAFSNANLLASFSFISFSICNHLAFSSTSLSASFSFNCLSISAALFLSSLGVSFLTILSISISSSSGTFYLFILILVLGFIYSVCAECLLASAISFAFCHCFCPFVLYCIMFVLAKSK